MVSIKQEETERETLPSVKQVLQATRWASPPNISAGDDGGETENYVQEI